MDADGRAYEDFVPTHEMVRHTPSHTLSVDLTAAGYKKEHIKVQMVHSHRRLVVRGERAVAGNRWSRFRLEFPVPDGCDVKGIHARFDYGVVLVIMPGLKEADAAEQVPPAAKTGAVAVAGGQGSEHPRGGVEEQRDGRVVEKKQEPEHQRAAQEGGRDGTAGVGGDDLQETVASPSPRGGGGGGYRFLQERKKLVTTVVGIVLVFFSLGVYVRYSLGP